jgi:rod shape-determining protein MreD
VSSYSRSRFRSIEVIAGPALLPTIGLVILAVFVQTVFAPLLTLRATVPSFVCIAVVLYAAKAEIRRGVLLAVIAGICEDCVAGTGGAWTIATTLTALAAGGVARAFFSEGFVALGALVAFGVLLRDAVFWISMSLQGYPRGFAFTHFHAALWQGAFSGLCAMLYLIARSRLVADRTAVERFP